MPYLRYARRASMAKEDRKDQHIWKETYERDQCNAISEVRAESFHCKRRPKRPTSFHICEKRPVKETYKRDLLITVPQVRTESFRIDRVAARGGCNYVWRDSFIWVHDSSICTTSLHICHMIHSYVWYDSLICVAWLIHVCDMVDGVAARGGCNCVWRDSFIWVTWLIHVCDMETWGAGVETQENKNIFVPLSKKKIKKISNERWT